MDTRLLYGKDVADKIKADLLQIADPLPSKDSLNTKATLAVVISGHSEDSMAYFDSIQRTAKDLPIDIRLVSTPEDVTKEALVDHLTDLNNDDDIDGILLMQPLPPSLDYYEIKEYINEDKDVDGITTINQGKLFAGDGRGFAPCTAEAVVCILDYYGISVEGKKAVIIGRSPVIGKPVSLMLLQKNATVTICHSRTKELEKITKEADLLIAAIGKAKKITADFVKEGAVVIDVGINYLDGKMVGDVDSENVEGVASALTPVPKGVGSVTTMVLFEHLIRAREKNHKIPV